MGGIVSKPNTPPPPAPPPELPTEVAPQVTGARAGAKARASNLRRSTILTSAQGLLDTGTSGQKTLLGN